MDLVRPPPAFARELARALLPIRAPASPVVTEADLADLPTPVQGYLRFMGVPGRSRAWSFRVAARGRFRRSHAEPWMACEAWQYNTRADIARMFRMKLRMGGILPVVAHDTYVAGVGRMLVRALDLFPVADVGGEELAIGELVTWLNDAVLLAPSMLLDGVGRFTAVDEAAFDVAVTDAGRTVRARVHLAPDGAPASFETTDRFVEDPADRSGPWLRARWRTPVDAWTRVDGRAIPRSARAVWDLPDGPLEYAELAFLPATLRFDVQPGE